MQKQVPLSKVKPNPFRNMERYPIDEAKIESLMGSMDRTGFWDNVIGRERNGHVQMAYGHHRRIAFEKKYGKNAKMTITIKELSDPDMLRVMADENVSEYGTSAEVEQETIRAVVQAYADGKITGERGMKKPPAKVQKSNLRCAPGFRRGCCADDAQHKYTEQTIADFLGWKKPNGQASARVRNALQALEAVERDVVDSQDVRGMGSSAAKHISGIAKGISDKFDRSAEAAERDGNVEGAKNLRRKGKKKAREEAKKLAKGVKWKDDKRTTIRGLEKEGREIALKTEKELGTKKVPPTVTRFCRNLGKSLYGLLGTKDKRWKDINELIKYNEVIPQEDIRGVSGSLRKLAARAERIADLLEDKTTGKLLK